VLALWLRDGLVLLATEDETMPTRRSFLTVAASLGVAAGLLPLPAIARELRQLLPTRVIPSTGETLPIIGLGNSNAFREGDIEASMQVIARLTGAGGSYVDCGGPSRLVVAEAAASINALDQLFLGTYFSGADDALARQEAVQLLKMTGRTSLDLMHNYPEDAAPNWDTFRGWKANGLTRHIGVSRHVKEAYPVMMQLMETGDVDILQVNYSLLETEAEERILPMAQDLGVAVTINRPFINGRFFDAVHGKDLPPWAADFDCDSWAQFSLKFILSHPAVTCVLTETANPKHAVDNLSAGLGRLPDASERNRMQAYFKEIVS
jgi:diketogulonate reductase-like aldo/keto reductase